MPAATVSKARSFLIRSLALVAAVATYAVSSVGGQVLGAAGVSSVLSAVGLSSIVLTTTATPADAQWRRRWRRRRWRGRRW